MLSWWSLLNCAVEIISSLCSLVHPPLDPKDSAGSCRGIYHEIHLFCKHWYMYSPMAAMVLGLWTQLPRLTLGVLLAGGSRCRAVGMARPWHLLKRRGWKWWCLQQFYDFLEAVASPRKDMWFFVLGKHCNGPFAYVKGKQILCSVAEMLSSARS